MENNTFYNKSMENANVLAKKFKDLNENKYGNSYKRYLLNNDLNLQEVSQYNDKMIDIVNDMKNNISANNSNIDNLKNQIKNQDSTINYNLALINELKKQGIQMEKNTITNDKIIENSVQKIIYSRNIFYTILIINIILFIGIIFLITKY